MNALTLEVIMRVVFGVTDAHTRDQLAPGCTGWSTSALSFCSARCSRGWIVGPWKRFRNNHNEIDALLYAEIDRSRHAADLNRRTDVLSRLLQTGHQSDDTPLTDAELRDQLVTLLPAGHETTAAALAWTLHELARHPGLQHRAYLATQDNDDRYLEATLEESMRLHPVIASTARKLTRTKSSAAGTDRPAPSSNLHPAGSPAPGQLPRREDLSA